MTKNKNCFKCNCEYYPSGCNSKYCESCRKRIKSDRVKAKWSESLKTGVIFGRTLQEEIYNRYRRGAEKRGVQFELSFDEFKLYWNLPRFYCLSDIETIGLDRVVNSFGYTTQNIVPRCTVCNNSKRAMSFEAFIRHCRRVAKVFENTGLP